MTAPTLGLALIAKNEESTLPHLLASTDGAFDQIALLDTGSTDRTVEVFEKWAKTQSNTNCRVGHFEWRDDFAAARNAADELLDTDWLCTADCDDEIIGAEAAVSHHPRRPGGRLHPVPLPIRRRVGQPLPGAHRSQGPRALVRARSRGATSAV
jgi:hypothetical protein